MTSTPKSIVETLSIGAPYTPAGEVLPLGVLQAETLSNVVHGDALVSVDYAPEGWGLTDTFAVVLEDGSTCALGTDGVLNEI